MQNNVDYDDYEPICIREHLLKQKPFLSGIAQITSPPNSGKLYIVQLLFDVKNDV